MTVVLIKLTRHKENKWNNTENIKHKRHASTNTHSADRVSRNTVIEPIGLRKFTPYIYQYTTAGSRKSQHNDSNIGPS